MRDRMVADGVAWGMGGTPAACEGAEGLGVSWPLLLPLPTPRPPPKGVEEVEDLGRWGDWAAESGLKCLPRAAVWGSPRVGDLGNGVR